MGTMRQAMGTREGATAPALTPPLDAKLRSWDGLLQQIPVGVCICDRHGTVVRSNQFAAEILGRTLTTGDPHQYFWQEIRIYSADGSRLAPERSPMRELLRTGSPIKDREVILERADGVRATILANLEPLLDERGVLIGGVSCFTDISDRKRTEQHNKALIDELNHRVKNTLATVQSLAAQTLRGADADAQAAFEGRLLALSGIHDRLSQERWESADLASVLSDVVAPYTEGGEARVRIAGVPVRLSPRTALTLALVFHELATNAAKYGALSSNKGGVEVSWEIAGTDKAPRVLISWVERDGPRIRPPTHEGFGATFVKRSIEYELDGRAELHFEPAGLRCTIELPWQDNGASPDVPTGSGKT